MQLEKEFLWPDAPLRPPSTLQPVGVRSWGAELQLGFRLPAPQTGALVQYTKCTLFYGGPVCRSKEIKKQINKLWSIRMMDY